MIGAFALSGLDIALNSWCSIIWSYTCKSQYNYGISWLQSIYFAPEDLTKPFLFSPQRDPSKDSPDSFKGQATLRAEKCFCLSLKSQLQTLTAHRAGSGSVSVRGISFHLTWRFIFNNHVKFQFYLCIKFDCVWYLLNHWINCPHSTISRIMPFISQTKQITVLI